MEKAVDKVDVAHHVPLIICEIGIKGMQQPGYLLDLVGGNVQPDGHAGGIKHLVDEGLGGKTRLRIELQRAQAVGAEVILRMGVEAVQKVQFHVQRLFQVVLQQLDEFGYPVLGRQETHALDSVVEFEAGILAGSAVGGDNAVVRAGKLGAAGGSPPFFQHLAEDVQIFLALASVPIPKGLGKIHQGQVLPDAVNLGADADRAGRRCLGCGLHAEAILPKGGGIDHVFGPEQAEGDQNGEHDEDQSLSHD